MAGIGDCPFVGKLLIQESDESPPMSSGRPCAQETSRQVGSDEALHDRSAEP